MVSHSFGRSTLGLLLPAIEDDLGITHTQAGRPGTAIYLAYIVGVALVAVLAPRVEPITIMRTALACAAIGLLICARSETVGMLTLGVGLTGGSGAGIWLTAPSLATAHVAPERRGMVISTLMSAIGLSNVALGFGTTALRQRLDDDLIWRPIWGIEALVTLSLLLALIVVARFSRTERISGGFSLSVLRSVPHATKVTIAFALFGAMSAGFGAFMLVALEEQGGFSRAESTTMFSVMGIVGMVAAPLLGGLSDRYGRRPFLVGAMAGLTASNVLVAMGGRIPLMVSVMIFGAMAGSFPALIATYVRDQVDNRAFSQVLATMTLLFSLLSAATPSSVGWLADTTGGFALPYLGLAAMAFVSMVLVAFVDTAARVQPTSVPSMT